MFLNFLKVRREQYWKKKEKSLKKEIQDFYLNGGTYDEKEIYFGDSVGKEKL
jgi:hypothetical protein